MIDDEIPNALHVPKNTYIWRIPIIQPIDIKSWGYIDPSRPENIKYEDVHLTFDEKLNVRCGLSRYLRIWIVADR